MPRLPRKDYTCKPNAEEIEQDKVTALHPESAGPAQASAASPAAPVLLGGRNIDDFGLDQSFESAHTEKLLTSTTIPHYFKVPPEWYFLVHPDPDMHFEATLLVVEKDKVLKGEYLLLPGLEAGLSLRLAETRS
jgi:hypothetical protein